MVCSYQKRLRFTALLLSAMLAFQSVGWLLAWKGLQVAAHFEAQGVLLKVKDSHANIAGTDNLLSQQTFHKGFFESLKVAGKKEIVQNGQLFDYRILAETGDSIVVTLYLDHPEQTLFKALGQVFKSVQKESNSSNAPVALWLAKWLGSAFIVPERPVVSASIDNPLQMQVFTSFHFAAQFAPGTFAPPPEL